MFPTDFATENPRRKARFDAPYDPIAGVGACGPRTLVAPECPAAATARIPLSMTLDPEYPAARNNADHWNRLRCRHDFEFWAATCVRIKDKLSGHIIPFVLNNPQRIVLEILENDRRQSRPLRLILLKARQWGGSTLVQMYMAWIQTTQRRNWHSLICAHLKDTARSILGMYDAMIQSYPENLWEGDTKPAFRPFERSVNIRELAGTGCRVTVSSAESQEALRGTDIAMAHLSETAFWPETQQKSPVDFMRTVCGSVALEPLTLIVIESTANGTGNFFHDEWQRNISGHGDKHPVFIPWYQIEIYTATVRDEQHAREIWQTLTPYEKNLWHKFSLSIEQIKWYHDKAREYPTADQMHAEFPTTPDEAFVNTGANVFAAEHIEALRAACSRPADTPPDRLLRAMPTGQLDIWQRPQSDTRYIAAVDVGGRTARADWSVIAVFTYDTVPELVAQWRGHIDHDLLADYAMTLAATYNRALLVVESNTLESENMESSAEGILTRMHTLYDNLYCRRAGATDDTPGTRPGLHTNRATKAAMIERLISAVRPPASYIERDSEACNELASYLCYPNGSYAARRGKHDDLLMTRAIALYVISLDPPRIPAPRHRLLPAILPRRLW